MDKYCLGVDVGGTTIKLAIVRQSGEIVYKWEIPTNKRDEGVNIPVDIHETFQKELDRLHINNEQILGIGAGAPGFVDTKTGYIYEAVNIGWKDFEFGRQLKQLTGLSVWVNNDANLAALGENWLGAGQDSDHLIAVTIGTGVGGGIIVNGQILNGANGTSAELGHVTMVPEGGELCNCGKTGCLETEASATGIVRKAVEMAKSNPTSALNSSLESGELTAKKVFEIAAEGDGVAKQVILDVIDMLGRAIANLAIAINPEKIVIGGGVSKAGKQLLQPLEESFKKYSLNRTAEACTFSIAELGNDAGVIGGAYLVKAHH